MIRFDSDLILMDGLWAVALCTQQQKKASLGDFLLQNRGAERFIRTYEG